jgi:uncharacterized CHY-type Zn-finger protein
MKLSLTEFFDLVEKNIVNKQDPICYTISCLSCPFGHECHGELDRHAFVQNKLDQYKQKPTQLPSNILSLSQFVGKIQANSPYYAYCSYCVGIICAQCPLHYDCLLFLNSTDRNAFILDSVARFENEPDSLTSYHYNMKKIEKNTPDILLSRLLHFISHNCVIVQRFRQGSKIDYEIEYNGDKKAFLQQIQEMMDLIAE